MRVKLSRVLVHVLRQLWKNRDGTVWMKICDELVSLPSFRAAVAIVRYETFSRTARNQNKPLFTILGSRSGITEQAVDHNIDPNWMFFGGFVSRPDLIAGPLMALPSIRQNSHRMRVLIVGARTEAEILVYLGLGFERENIVACDLFSYSPEIELANVIELPYPDREFDVVVVGWVLEFVTEVEKATQEVRRVCKFGGLICVGGMYHPKTMDWDQYIQANHQLDRVWRPLTAMDVVEEFKHSREDAVFLGDVFEGDADKRNDLVVIFRNRVE